MWMPRARGPGSARAVRARGRLARSRGNVAAPGLRREPGGDAARRGRTHRGGRARTRTIPPALRRALHHRDQGCRFPGCRFPFGQGHHSAIGRKAGPPRSRTSLCSVAGTTARCTRRGIRPTPARWRVTVPAAGWPAPSRSPGPGRGAPDPVQALRAQHEAQGSACTPGRVPVLAGGAPGCGLRDRCPASPGHTSPGIVKTRGQPAFDWMIAAAGLRA